MNAYRNQQKMDGEVLTIVSNNSNFIKGADNAPVLISWTDATTLFHEFGHALHGLSSNVTYTDSAGTAVVGLISFKFWSAGLKLRSVKQVCIAL
jgi:peptidyl-dipeptidase Dcp